MPIPVWALPTPLPSRLQRHPQGSRLPNLNHNIHFLTDIDSEDPDSVEERKTHRPSPVQHSRMRWQTHLHPPSANLLRAPPKAHAHVRGLSPAPAFNAVSINSRGSETDRESEGGAVIEKIEGK